MLSNLPPHSRIALIRLRSLGDCVLTTPAIHLLKRHRPDLHLAVVAEPRFFPIFENNPDLDAVLPPTVRALRRFAPHLCVNLHGNGRTARLTLLSGARHRAAFAHFRHRWVYNTPIPTAQQVLGLTRKVHTAEHIASAVFHLGVPHSEIPHARLFAGNTPLPHRIAGPYAVIHPPASHPAKTWPAPFFLQVAQHLRRELDIQPVFIAGPGEDLSQFQMWPTFAGQPLSAIKRLLRDAALFLGNDSGPAHMAAAFQIPTFVLFGASDPIIWGPWQCPGEAITTTGPIHEILPAQVSAILSRMRVHA
jgi:ADP-heptose:LPS heptosyltransferase